jgi:hypothetical protein
MAITMCGELSFGSYAHDVGEQRSGLLTMADYCIATLSVR